MDRDRRAAGRRRPRRLSAVQGSDPLAGDQDEEVIRAIRRHPRMRRPAGSPQALSRAALLRRAPSREAGALTLSYVIIVPVFLVGIMTIVQVSIWYLARD